MTPLGESIRKHRRARGLTLKSHAALVGVSPGYLSALEHGKRGAPTEEMLRRIAAALELDQDDVKTLMTLSDISRPKVTISTSGLNPLATELVNRIANCITELSSAELSDILWVLENRRRGKDQAD